MDVYVRQVVPEDLDAVTRVEAVCFPEAEAAARDSFSQRISVFPESFFVAEQDGRIIGFINGAGTRCLRTPGSISQMVPIRASLDWMCCRNSSIRALLPF